MCGATNLGEALRRIGEGAAMIRSKGEAGTGDIVEAVRHLRMISGEIRRLTTLDPDGAADRRQGAAARRCSSSARSPRDGRLPVVLFCAGGIATPADASLVMQLGAEGVFVGSGIFKSEDPERRARAIVEATTHFADPAARRRRLDRASAGAMVEPRDLQARGRAAARPARLVGSRLWPVACRSSASSRSRATSRRTRRFSSRSAPRRGRSGCPRDLDGLDALIIPGGESTVMTLGIEREGLAEPLRAFARRGAPVLGTCAGLIMLDRDHLGVLDVAAQRNAFGRQLRSFETDLELAGLDGGPVHAVFIRAPWVRERGPTVEVLGEVDGHPVAVRQGNVLAISFHPELTGEDRVHRLLLSLI